MQCVCVTTVLGLSASFVEHITLIGPVVFAEFAPSHFYKSRDTVHRRRLLYEIPSIHCLDYTQVTYNVKREVKSGVPKGFGISFLSILFLSPSLKR